MTYEQFKATLVSALYANSSKELVVNYEINEGNYEIRDIALKIGNFTLAQLQQATSINMKIPAAGTVLNIPLVNEQSALKRISTDIAGEYYIYHFSGQSFPIMTAAPESNPPIPSEEGYTEIVLLPDASVGKFAGSGYDALSNNNKENRLSSYIMVSDRKTLYTRPLDNTQTPTVPGNFDSIINNTADFAEVQDSNYTSTGWIRGRYVGTSIDSGSNSNISPVLFIKSFLGKLYPSGTLDTVIQRQNTSGSNQIDYETFLHTGVKDLPTAELVLDPVTNSPVPTSIYRAEGNKAVTVGASKIWVSDSDTIIYVNITGSVIGSNP